MLSATQKVKHALSADNEAEFKIEDMMEEDFDMPFMRDEFDELISDLKEDLNLFMTRVV